MFSIKTKLTALFQFSQSQKEAFVEVLKSRYVPGCSKRLLVS